MTGGILSRQLQNDMAEEPSSHGLDDERVELVVDLLLSVEHTGPRLEQVEDHYIVSVTSR